MRYAYTASQTDGQIVQNEFEARNIAEVLNFLTLKNLKPISIKPIGVRMAKIKYLFGGRITLTDQIFLSKYLSLMLKLGTGLLQAIDILIEDFERPAMRSFLFEIRSNLEKGLPFFGTFARYPKVFSQVYINVVRAGEAAGNLDKVFENLTSSLSKE